MTSIKKKWSVPTPLLSPSLHRYRRIEEATDPTVLCFSGWTMIRLVFPSLSIYRSSASINYPRLTGERERQTALITTPINASIIYAGRQSRIKRHATRRISLPFRFGLTPPPPPLLSFVTAYLHSSTSTPHARLENFLRFSSLQWSIEELGPLARNPVTDRAAEEPRRMSSYVEPRLLLNTFSSPRRVPVSRCSLEATPVYYYCCSTRNFSTTRSRWTFFSFTSTSWIYLRYEYRVIGNPSI